MNGREYYTYALFFVVHQHLLHGNKLFVAFLFACLENLTGIKVLYLFSIIYICILLGHVTYPNVPCPIFATFSYLLLSSQ